MFENIDTLNIKGGYFKNCVSLEILKHRFNLIYGRNGSGKTSISSAIDEYRKDDEELEGKKREFEVSFNEELDISQKKRIFVFNEEFVNKKVKLDSSDGLATIVMLGEIATIQTQINDLKEKSKPINNDFDSLEKQKNTFDDDNAEISPNFKFRSLKESLSEWAQSDSLLRGNRRNTSINPDTINDIKSSAGEYDSNFDVVKMQNEYDANLALYNASSSGDKITWYYTKIEFHEIAERLFLLLNKIIEKPETTERDKIIINLLTNHSDSHFVNEAKIRFGNDDVTSCPLCMREITKEEKSDLLMRINNLLSKDVELYQNKLTDMKQKFSDVELNLTSLGTMFGEEKVSAEFALTQLNQDLKLIRILIDNKNNDVYREEKIDFNIDEFDKKVNKYNDSLKAIYEKVIEFNENIQHHDDKKIALIEQNKRLVYHKKKCLFDNYYSAQIAKNEINDKYIAKKTEKEKYEQDIKNLEQQKKMVSIAQDVINKYLSYVFYDKDRMSLKAGDNAYSLLVNGNAITPDKVSVGERNIIGLCYFFASMFEGKEKGHEFDDEMLVVIDDPISSFDFENKVGVASLIRLVCSMIFDKNENSKILILSHDLQTIFNLNKVRDDVDSTMKCELPLELVCKNIIKMKNSQRNEYTKMLNDIYDFASGATDEKSLAVGNEMRKVLEAYSSFIYRMPMDKAFHDKDILAIIPSDKRDYYENFMFRLVLNGTSHEEESVYSLSSLYEYYTIEEKRRTAKCFLLMLYYINKSHLLDYLP